MKSATTHAAISDLPGVYMQFWRRRFPMLTLAILTTCQAAMCFAVGSARADAISDDVLVYYANETRPDVLESTNYKRLIAALLESKMKDAELIVSQLRNDTEIFPRQIETDVGAITAAALQYRFTAVMFTNELARRGKFQLVDGSSGTVSTKHFDVAPAEQSQIFHYAPLSRRESFQAAAKVVQELQQASGKGLVLVTASHGDEQMALMPRVIVDLSAVEQQEYVAYLRQPESRGGSLPPFIINAGISKTDFWKDLSAAGIASRLRLVIRASCQGGVLTLSEFNGIPHGVGAIGHTGRAPWEYAQIDYPRLFSDLRLDRSLSGQMGEFIGNAGVKVETIPMVGMGILKELVIRASPVVLFIPLLVWCFWVFRRLRAAASH